MDITVAAVYEAVGSAIAARRRKHHRKLSQGQLAAAVGISRASIANIERGRHRIQLHVLYEIAAALELEPHDLLPHPTRETAHTLPHDMSDQLSPKEVSAVSRLVAGKKGESHD